MEPLEAIEILAERARQELAPQTDIPVRQLLAACQRETSVFTLLAWPAAISAVAACILLSLALHLNQTKSDAVTPLFAPLQVDMP